MIANGHTSGDERETFMEFVNFDGRVTGETARRLIKAANVAECHPQALLDGILTQALAERLNTPTADQDVKVEPMTINAGNGGFHVVTVVADGYGNLIAEDMGGKELAQVANRPGATAADLIADLIRQRDANAKNPHVS